jgi:hypothetical protein
MWTQRVAEEAVVACLKHYASIYPEELIKNDSSS